MTDSKRNTDLKRVLFPVSRQPVFLRATCPNVDEAQIEDPVLVPQFHKVPRFSAIVADDDRLVFAVVSQNYKFVTNEEAIELGEECFRTVFSGATARDMEVFNITMTKTRSFCHIDYVNKNDSFEPWKNDKWVPYLRVTNSYNRTKPLRFDLGFCRWICTNGMIFGDKSIRFRYIHTRGDMGTVEFTTTFGDIKRLEAQFIERLHNLKRYYVPEEYMLALVCKVFNVNATAEDFTRPRRKEHLIEFRDHVGALVTKYVEELGPNGYAALNVLTDFASRPRLYISPESMVGELQKRSGDWVTEFLDAMQDTKFDFRDYLGEFSDVAELLVA